MIFLKVQYHSILTTAYISQLLNMYYTKYDSPDCTYVMHDVHLYGTQPKLRTPSVFGPLKVAIRVKELGTI